MRFIVRFVINAIAIWLTATLVSGITLTSDVVGIAIVVLLFGIVNTVIRPIIRLLTLPLTVITLGLFTFVINAAMLMVTAWLAQDYLSLGDSLGTQLVNAFIGSLVISIVSTVLGWILPD